jgi:hypothetical protein
MNYRVERWVAGINRGGRMTLTSEEIDLVVNSTTHVYMNGPKKPRWRLRASQWRRFKKRVENHERLKQMRKSDRHQKTFLDFLKVVPK